MATWTIHVESLLDPEVYRQQVLAAMSAGDYQRKRKRGEVQRRLIVIKTIADEFAAQENYAAALTIYEVLVTEVIEHFNDYRDEYVAFSRTGRSAVSTRPTITKQDIRSLVGEQNFLKGQQGVRDGAIVNPEQQAMALKAYCYGSLPEPFRVQVTFDDSGITASLCSCSGGAPVHGNRGCEHVAAAPYMEYAAGSVHANGRHRYHPGTTEQSSVDYTRQAVTPETAGGRDASQADGWQLLKLADLFVQYGQDSTVERMIYEKAQQERYTMYADWLKNHHLAKNNLAAALEMAELILRRRPWFAEYQKVRELAMQFGNLSLRLPAATRYALHG